MGALFLAIARSHPRPRQLYFHQGIMWRRRGVVRGRGVAPRGRPPHTCPHTPAHSPHKLSGVAPVAGEPRSQGRHRRHSLAVLQTTDTTVPRRAAAPAPVHGEAQPAAPDRTDSSRLSRRKACVYTGRRCRSPTRPAGGRLRQCRREGEVHRGALMPLPRPPIRHHLGCHLLPNCSKQ